VGQQEQPDAPTQHGGPPLPLQVLTQVQLSALCLPVHHHHSVWASREGGEGGRSPAAEWAGPPMLLGLVDAYARSAAGCNECVQLIAPPPSPDAQQLVW
jgi:hypothetical protein